MPKPTPAQPSADRNLPFGILAAQLDFVSRDALIAAMNAWVLAKHPARLTALSHTVHEFLFRGRAASLAGNSPVPVSRPTQAPRGTELFTPGGYYLEKERVRSRNYGHPIVTLLEHRNRARC
jgi:hypothetical protein